MKIIDLEKYEGKDDFKPHKVIQEEDVEVVLLIFKPGQGLPVHKTPVDVFFHIIEGIPDIKVGDEVKEVSSGSLVWSPKDIPHTIENNSSDTVRVLVVKTPNPSSVN